MSSSNLTHGQTSKQQVSAADFNTDALNKEYEKIMTSLMQGEGKSTVPKREEEKPNVSYANAATKKITALAQEELDKLTELVNTVPIDQNTIQVNYIDIAKSSTLTAYYRNFREKIFSLFSNLAGGLENLQAVNALLISEITGAKITWIDYQDEKEKKAVKYIERIGNIERLEKVYSEIIFILRMKKDIDYETSEINYSDITKWMLKKVSLFNDNGANFHYVFTPDDHRYCQEKLNLRTDSLAYRCFIQLLSLIAYTFYRVNDSKYYKLLQDIISAKGNKAVIKHTANDLKDIDLYHVWNNVTSPLERGMIINKLRKAVPEIVKFANGNIWIQQNLLLRKFRNGDSDAHAELKELNSLVKRGLTNSFFSVLYGRLKEYHGLRKTEPGLFPKNPKTGVTSQLPYGDFLRVMETRNKLDLFAEENITSIFTGAFERSTEIGEITSLARLDRPTNKVYYRRDELGNSILYKRILRELEGPNPSEKLQNFYTCISRNQR